jgi:hypothetical protein
MLVPEPWLALSWTSDGRARKAEMRGENTLTLQFVEEAALAERCDHLDQG